MIHLAFECWFGIPIPDEYESRLPDDKLMCLKPDLPKQQPLNNIFAGIGISSANEFRKSLDNLSMECKKEHLRQKWSELLGEIEPKFDPTAKIIAYEIVDGVQIARGIIAGYGSLLDHLFCYIPHDAVIPGVLTAGDLPQIASILAPRPLRIESPIDGRNCPISSQKLESIFEPAILAYKSVPDALRLLPETMSALGPWLEKMMDQE